MAIEGFHVRVRLTRVIYVVRAVASAAAVDAPNAVDVADSQFGSMGAALRFVIRNALAGVFGDLEPLAKMNGCETAFAVNG